MFIQGTHQSVVSIGDDRCAIDTENLTRSIDDGVSLRDEFSACS